MSEFLRRLVVDQFTEEDLLSFGEPEGEAEGEEEETLDHYIFDQNISGIVVVNDSADELSVKINNMTFTVLEDERFEEFFEPFDIVYFSGDNMSFRAWGRK